ncbi:unnamed protein product [Amoebophrya sp. A120]|nr:unnamed protein product [Amoebophrya sp. A120]|eukprot:GSA120T00017925001.1
MSVGKSILLVFSMGHVIRGIITKDEPEIEYFSPESALQLQVDSKELREGRASGGSDDAVAETSERRDAESAKDVEEEPSKAAAEEEGADSKDAATPPTGSGFEKLQPLVSKLEVATGRRGKDEEGGDQVFYGPHPPIVIVDVFESKNGEQQLYVHRSIDEEQGGQKDARPPEGTGEHRYLGIGLDFKDLGDPGVQALFAHTGEPPKSEEGAAKHQETLGKLIQARCARAQESFDDSEDPITMLKMLEHKTQNDESTPINAKETCEDAVIQKLYTTEQAADEVAVKKAAVAEDNPIGREGEKEQADAAIDGEQAETSFSALELPPPSRSSSRQPNKPAATQQKKLAVELKGKQPAMPPTPPPASSALQVNVKKTTVKTTTLEQQKIAQRTHRDEESSAKADGEDGGKSNTEAAGELRESNVVPKDGAEVVQMLLTAAKVRHDEKNLIVLDLGGADGTGKGYVHFDSKGQSKPATPPGKSGAHEYVAVDVSLDPDGLGKMTFAAGESNAAAADAAKAKYDTVVIATVKVTGKNDDGSEIQAEKILQRKGAGKDEQSAEDQKSMILYGVAAVGSVVLVSVLLFFCMRGKPALTDEEIRGVDEDDVEDEHV